MDQDGNRVQDWRYSRNEANHSSSNMSHGHGARHSHSHFHGNMLTAVPGMSDTNQDIKQKFSGGYRTPLPRPSGNPTTEFEAGEGSGIPGMNAAQNFSWKQPPSSHHAQFHGPPYGAPPPPSRFPPPHLPPPPPVFNPSAPPPSLPDFSRPPPPQLQQPPPRLQQLPPQLQQLPPQFEHPPPQFQQLPPPVPPQFLVQQQNYGQVSEHLKSSAGSSLFPSFPSDTNKPLHHRHSLEVAVKQRPSSEDVGEGTDSSPAAQGEVNDWLRKMGKLKVKDFQPDEKEESTEIGEESRKSLTVCEMHNKLRWMLCRLAALQGALQQLSEEQDTVTQEAWEQGVNKIIQLKEEYMKARLQLEKKEVCELKSKIDKRRKKRARLRSRKQEEQADKEEMLFERAQKHTAIDKWRDQILQEHLRQKQVKEMKETADKTLSKVRREIREARKTVETLTALQKLRTIRTDTAARRGQTFPADVAQHFTEKTDDLVQLLSRQIEAYEKEEAALKLILETEREAAKEKEREARRLQEEQKRQQEIQLEAQSLFGPSVLRLPGDPLLVFDSYYQQAQFDLQSLLSVRNGWDLCRVPESVQGASRIPDSWVDPMPPSSSVWASALQADCEADTGCISDFGVKSDHSSVSVLNSEAAP